MVSNPIHVGPWTYESIIYVDKPETLEKHRQELMTLKQDHEFQVSKLTQHLRDLERAYSSKIAEVESLSNQIQQGPSVQATQKPTQAQLEHLKKLTNSLDESERRLRILRGQIDFYKALIEKQNKEIVDLRGRIIFLEEEKTPVPVGDVELMPTSPIPLGFWVHVFLISFEFLLLAVMVFGLHYRV